MIERESEFLRCGRFLSSSFGGPNDVKSALLGKEPRYSPDRTFDTLHIRLDLDIDLRRRQIDGRCTTRLRAISDNVQSLVFDAAPMRIQGVFFEGKRVRHSHEEKELKVQLSRHLKAGDEAEIEIRYSVREPKTGFHFVPDPKNPKGPAIQAWSQGQPEDSKYWFPCHDAPHEKTTSEIIATVPQGFTAVSNGILLERKEQGRKVTYHWRMNHSHSIYLITLAVGRFGVAEDRWEHVPLTFYAEKGREQDAKRGLAKTAKAMEFFSKSIGVPYPYEKYAQVCVKEFPGGMENTSATTMTEACLIDKRAALDADVDLLMSHELAHQWFGDLLTCRDWSHAWLNEGFATYFETLFTLDDKGQDEFDYELYRNAQAYFGEDRDRYRRPIVTSNFKNPWVVFDRHLYEKAGWVLHMLRSVLGDKAWWRAIGHYVRKHRYQSVETSDFIAAIEESTGKNLRGFFDQWIYRSGYPSFKVQVQWTQAKKTVDVWILQTQSISDESPLFKMNAELRFEGKGWVRKFKKQIDRKEHAWNFRLPGPPLSVEFDPDHVILKKLDFKKPWAMWVHQLHHAPRALSRIHAAHEVSRWSGSASVEAIAAALRREKFWGAAGEMASALAGLGTPEAFEALKSFVRHRNPKIRRAVIDALSEFKSPEVAKIVLPLSRRDPSLFVEAAATRALSSGRDARYAPVIRRKLSEKSYSDVLLSGAISGLATLRDPRFLPVLHRLSLPQSTFPARAHAIRALAVFASISDEVVPWLLEYIEDHDERVANAAINSIGRTNDPRALAPLERLRDKTHDTRIRTFCEEAIVRIRSGFEKMDGAFRRRESDRG